MKRIVIIVMGLTFILVACSSNDKTVTPSDMMDSSGGAMMMGHGHDDIALQASTGENELKVPPILNSDKEEGDHIYYTIEAQKGQTEIFEGFKTETLGYNSSFLGPVLKLKKGQTIHITLKNKLDEATTFHWHGLIISGEGDGGPHEVIKPGEEKEVVFKVKQDRATLWFHPHPEGQTSKQVFEGLAGLMYIEDDQVDPYVYGENDFPLIVQDRTFSDEKQLDYDAVKNSDGTMGDTLLINGTLNPRLTVNREKVRLRLLNGSNMRNYTFKLSNNQSFQQVASDGGLLSEPVELTELQLTPAERAEIIIDFSTIKENEEVKLVMDDDTILLPFQLNDDKEIVQSKKQNQQGSFKITEEERQKEVTKKIELFGMMEQVTINGKKFDMDRIDLTQAKGETEIWEIYNKPDMMGGMIHPFHIHGTQFKVISINGEEPPGNLQGYKDTIALEPGDKAEIAVKFEETGIYMYHCHILEHEDNGMMGQIKVN